MRLKVEGKHISFVSKHLFCPTLFLCATVSREKECLVISAWHGTGSTNARFSFSVSSPSLPKVTAAAES